MLFDTRESNACLEVDSALAERTFKGLANGRFFVRNEARQTLDNRYFCAERTPDRSELDTNDTAEGRARNRRTELNVQN